MKYSKVIFLFLSLSLYSFAASSQSKKQLIQYRKIYDCILADYFLNTTLTKPFNVMVVNEPVNDYLTTVRYDIYEDILATKLSMPVNDSLWKNFFDETITQKKYRYYRIPTIANQKDISFTPVSIDSIQSVFRRGGYDGEFYRVFGSGTVGYISFSSVLLSRDGSKAIVELSHSKGNNDGMGVLYLLEKDKHGDWQVVGQNTIWIA